MTVEVFYVMCPQSYCKQNTPPSHLRNGCCCVLDSAGGFRKLPLQENRPRTCHPERSEGSQTIVGKAKHLKRRTFTLGV